MLPPHTDGIFVIKVTQTKCSFFMMTECPGGKTKDSELQGPGFNSWSRQERVENIFSCFGCLI